MNLRTVAIKPETRNHKGFFVQDADYTFVEIDKSGWALICVDDAVCHYVDPDNILTAESEMPKALQCLQFFNALLSKEGLNVMRNMTDLAASPTEAAIFVEWRFLNTLVC